MFCAMALWKKGWLFAPIPHTLTFKFRVARRADPWAGMSAEASNEQKMLNFN
jgi:hypothetical protein